MCVFIGGSGSGKAECLGKFPLPHMTSVESDSSDRQVTVSQTIQDAPCSGAYILHFTNEVYFIFVLRVVLDYGVLLKP